MQQADLAELLAWGGVRVGARRARVLVVDALDDFPGQGSTAALLAETGDDVRTGAELLARAVCATEIALVLPEGARGVAPAVQGSGASGASRASQASRFHEIRAPHVHPLGNAELLVAWLRTLPRFDGAGADDFIVRSAATAVAAASSSHGRPRLDTWVTVSGEVREPGTFLVPLGTPVAALLKIGGGVPQAGAVPYAAAGGALRRVCSSEGIDANVGSIVVLRRDHVLVRNDALSWDVLLRRADSTCERCGLCDAVCPAGVARPARLLDALRAPRSAAAIGDVAACIGCRVCEMVCPTGLGIGRIADTVAQRSRARGAEPGPARSLQFTRTDTWARRLGIASTPPAPRDVRDHVARVRFAMVRPDRVLRPLRTAGAQVWAGEPVARGAEGECVLAPFRGVVTHSGSTLTIRRRRP